MMNILPNVKHMKRYMTCIGFWKGLSAIRASQISSLDCYYAASFMETIRLYSNLQKLTIRRARTNTLKFIADNIKCFLKEICIHFTRSQLNDQNIEIEMKKLIKSQIKLEHIEINSDYNICKLMIESIENGLFETNDIQRNLMKFTFYFDGDINNGKSLMACIRRLILQINNCKIRDFMICCELNVNDDL
eukprot:175254_1